MRPGASLPRDNTEHFNFSYHREKTLKVTAKSFLTSCAREHSGGSPRIVVPEQWPRTAWNAIRYPAFVVGEKTLGGPSVASGNLVSSEKAITRCVRGTFRFSLFIASIARSIEADFRRIAVSCTRYGVVLLVAQEPRNGTGRLCGKPTCQCGRHQNLVREIGSNQQSGKVIRMLRKTIADK